MLILLLNRILVDDSVTIQNVSTVKLIYIPKYNLQVAYY